MLTLKFNPRRLLTLRSLLLVVGIVLLAWGGYQFYLKHRATSGTGNINLTKTVTTSTKKPDESKVDPNAGYKVPPDQPKLITLPTLGVSGLIQKVGIDQQNRIAVPGNVNVAGWYVNSVAPGQKGLSIIDGHVHGIYSPGIFEKLGQLHVADSFSIEFGDGSIKKFAVVSKQDLTIADANQKIFAKDPALDSQLNLMTCSGTFDKKTAEYVNRLLIVAKPT